MNNILTIATWNISEGHLVKSAQLFDYEHQDNLEYFIDELRKIKPDIICLQEVNLPKGLTSAQGAATSTSRIAKALEFSNLHEAPMHQSLFQTDDLLGLGLISTMKFSTKEIPLEQPDFPLKFANGTPAYDHIRWLFIADFDSFTLGTAHNWPMKIFQYSYSAEPGAGYGRYLDDTYRNALPIEKPLIITGDLNFDSPEKVMPRIYTELNLQEALPQNQPTDNVGDHPDHILFSPAFECLEAKIIPGRGDHYLCYAKLSLKI